MVGNTFGRFFRITTSGESYSGAFRAGDTTPKELAGGLVVTVDGVPAGLTLTPEFIQEELDKRRPGQSEIDTPRAERDKAYILSGVMEDWKTTGAPVSMLIPNSDMLESSIEKHRGYKETVRPGQAAFTYFKKYGEYADWLGAGRASGRETAARVAGGAVAKAVLDKEGIEVIAYTIAAHGIQARPLTFEEAKAGYRKNMINCPDADAAEKMIADILEVKAQDDSVGGVVEIIARGVPAGLGEPVFDKLQALLGHALFSVAAIKGIEFGAGFQHASMRGSESNDTPYFDASGKVQFRTNRAGGIQGGISNGQEIRIRCAVKPTPTIAVPQETVDVFSKTNKTEQFIGRNDPTLLPRIGPVCEAMVRIALTDALFMAKGYRAVMGMDAHWDSI